MDMPCSTVILTDFTASGRRSAPLIPAWASGWCNCSAGQLPNRLCLLEEAGDEGGSLPLSSAHIKSTKAGSPFDRKLHSSLTCARGFNYRRCGWRPSATLNHGSSLTARCGSMLESGRSWLGMYRHDQCLAGQPSPCQSFRLKPGQNLVGQLWQQL